MEKEVKPQAGGYSRMMPELIPSKTALLVVDMINDLVHPQGVYGKQGLSNPKVNDITPSIVKVMGACRSLGIPSIGIVTITHRNADGIPVDLGPVLAQRTFLRQEGLIPGTWGTQIIDELPPCDFIIEKIRLNSFFNTGLESLLRGLGVQTVLIAGIQTNYCVESTARAAWDLDYQFALLEDCVTCFDPRLHQASLETLANLGGVAGSDYVIEVLKRSK